ncbi:MAG: UvrD-helicase domain-containing protein [Flavobacteriales bacterium]|nr:UvrD-helicase domain-containing protein [Flavobacteriales bacterium]MCB9447058.1 UvrD-helicase domain-containing protein [Flavobacteriales bacterium]
MGYLDHLNDAQRHAIECLEGPVMVIAGAGSGKTRVLTYRIVHLMRNDVDAFNILALTFTNKAAREMKNRIMEIVGDHEARNLWMGTFHSVFARILRMEGERLGYPSNFTIYDTDDSKSLLRSIIKERNLDDKVYQPGYVLHRISSAKNSLISVAEYKQDPNIQSDDHASGRTELATIFQIYSERCFKAGAMDFDDILVNTYRLLKEFPEVLHKYQHKFRYIMVDEYQDTNHAQYAIIKKLASAYQNICVVGDDAQSIYGFRGANIQNILNFEKDYPDLQVFRLEQNYRSTQTIVNAANSLISHNRERLRKEVWTANEAGQPIRVMRAHSDQEEGKWVAQSVFQLKMEGQHPNSDFAVLYRTNAQSRAMEEAFRRLNIPYKIYGGISFYQRKEIKDLLAYFRMLINPHDEEALKRIINYPARGIGQTTVDKLGFLATSSGNSYWEVLQNPGLLNQHFNRGVQSKLNGFSALIKHFHGLQSLKAAYEVAEEIASTSGLMKSLYDDKTPEGISRYENIQELLNGVRAFCDKEELDMVTGEVRQKTLSDFMQDIALLTDSDRDDEENPDRVLMMTVHAAKGLEFPYVFVVGMEENLFPSQLSVNSRADLEEERRLFYVAITRAKSRAFLSYATSRFRWGNLVHCEPSRFLEEIDEQYLELPNMQQRKAIRSAVESVEKQYQVKKKEAINTLQRKLVKISKPTQPEAPFEADDSSALQAGMEVEHQRFGKGKILKIEGSAENRKATVFFPAAGQKQLLLKYAKLKIR